MKTTPAISALLFAALMAAPAFAQHDDGPISTNVTGIKEQLIRTPLIADAPTDDFNRVAWCHGALSGHMDLAEKITAIEPLSEDMQKIGASYLRAYEASLTLSKKGESKEGRDSAEAAREKGFNGWDDARKAASIKEERGRAAGAYVNWSLPGDCERAAIALSGHPDIFKEMQTEEEAKIIAEALKPSAERQKLDVHKEKTATVAPTDDKEAIGRAVAKTEPKEKGNWASGLMSKIGWGKKDGE
ncbi:hypothetical protein PQU92_04615 [Asticcacaulis sp. BYS171W]|uniref:Uncharacterized protein n=1 Tax=Asticcacaulis aquaticus TaxID=2984212 RepID=A0ABT5HR42_9CAUL|nr:hypothetical protein [Asticcacaulis aquaticus]MDC7682545.1 hypothetical protein [Asticcacaulis aquaticus]